MLDYTDIKSMAAMIKRPVKNLLALSPGNDPFYADAGHRRREAEWFAALWHSYGLAAGVHLRRIHYRVISEADEGAKVRRPDGREYQNTMNDWQLLVRASLSARYLDLVPFDAIVDRRNDAPMIHVNGFPLDPNRDRKVSCDVFGPRMDAAGRLPDEPSMPFYSLWGLDTAEQDYVVEVWIEKSTQNDWLVPLCQRRGVNLVVGIGEQSETRSRELALRARDYGPAVRVIYISDFDPSGQSMPKAVARKVEFTIAKFDLDIDLQLIPLALTPDQCLEYRLPRTPIKETERRRDKFEQIFGAGATELDALEAKHPGEMARLLDAEIDRFLDPELERRVQAAWWEQRDRLRKIENSVEDDHAEEIEALGEEYEEIKSQLAEWEQSAQTLWRTITNELRDRKPDLSDVPIPRSEAPGESERFVLFDSGRSYLSQMDFYQAWREGDAS